MDPGSGTSVTGDAPSLSGRICQSTSLSGQVGNQLLGSANTQMGLWLRIHTGDSMLGCFQHLLAAKALQKWPNFGTRQTGLKLNSTVSFVTPDELLALSVFQLPHL